MIYWVAIVAREIVITDEAQAVLLFPDAGSALATTLAEYPDCEDSIEVVSTRFWEPDEEQSWCDIVCDWAAAMGDSDDLEELLSKAGWHIEKNDQRLCEHPVGDLDRTITEQRLIEAWRAAEYNADEPTLITLARIATKALFTDTHRP